MMGTLKKLAVIMMCAAAMSGCTKTKLVIDSDVGSSTDDLFAFELAARYHREGLVDFAAVMIDRPGADNLAFTKAFLHYHGLDDVAIGTIEGTTEGQKVFVPYSRLVHDDAAAFAVPATRPGRVEEAVRLYRRVLADSADSSVDICAIGFFVNLMRLLDSPGDDLSPLTGRDLVARKVRKLRIMAGSFDRSLAHPEYNVWGDVPSATRIFSSWPTEIVVTPYETGVKIYSPRTEVLADYPAGHPIARVYQAWDPDGPRSKSQLMWDPMTVLGIADEECRLGFFADSPKGRVAVDADGFTTFTSCGGGNTTLQTLTAEKALAVRSHMRSLGGGEVRKSTLETSPIRIVGISAAPPAGEEEFVTLANVSSQPVSLDGMRIVCSQPEEEIAVSYGVPAGAGVTLPPGGELAFRRSSHHRRTMPDQALNVLVYAANGDVLAEAFIDSRWFDGAVLGTGRSFRARDAFPLPVEPCHWRLRENDSKIVVLDCDPGTDDSAAMFLMSRAGAFPDVCVATYGNMPLAVTTDNLRLMCAYLAVTPVLYSGAASPLSGEPPTCGDFHGADGLGGIAQSLKTRFDRQLAVLPAVKGERELAARILAAGEVTYIATGPLATLAKLLASEPRVKERIRRVLVMGGGIKSFNMPHDTEYNFAGDPEAVRQVLSSGLDITLFPLDLTHREALLDAATIDRLEGTGRYPEMIRLFRCNLESNVKTSQSGEAAVLHDALPCLYAIHPEAFTVEEMRLSVNEWGHTEIDAAGYPVHVATALRPGFLRESLTHAFGE